MSKHVQVFTMGGTIDKDYPRLTSGYAFEFGEESAASRILNAHPNLGITFNITSICKKDSLEVTDDDRLLLAKAINNKIAESTSRIRIVVTHGTDTMVETSQYIQKQIGTNTPAAVAFTGATKPERFVDSDASFNVGLAIGATSICDPGSVVICMNGNVIPAEKCVRDQDTGLYRTKWSKSMDTLMGTMTIYLNKAVPLHTILQLSLHRLLIHTDKSQIVNCTPGCENTIYLENQHISPPSPIS